LKRIVGVVECIINLFILLILSEIITYNDFWKWGIASRRYKISDFPRLKQFLFERYSIDANRMISYPDTFNTLVSANHVAKVKEVFATALPAIKVSFDESCRLTRAVGKSYTDILEIQRNMPIHLPDAVVSPANHDEVVEILQICSQYNIAVVPFGGGSNVVGAFKRREYNSPCVVLDMSLMKSLLQLDQVNHIAVFQGGIFGPELETLLNAKNLTLGHFPQSFEFSALGGWVATHSAGQESSGYGRIEDMVVSLKVATPTGTMHTSSYEHDAEGINLKSLFYGSEGMFGVITEVSVRVHNLPANKKWLVALFPNFEQGTEAVRTIVQKNLHPAVVRFSDEQETFFLQYTSHKPITLFSRIKSNISKSLLTLKGIKTPCLFMLRFDGEKEDNHIKSVIASEIVKKHKGMLLGGKLGIKWERSRFDLPYLRDNLLENGMLVDTMETVLPWNKIPEFKRGLLAELQKSSAFGFEKGVLMSHLSHVYQSSCSIYFTVITVQDVADTMAQWESLKKTVTDFIVGSGGAVSHHHSIGRMHQPWYVKKTDKLSQEILRNIKHTLDPNHILNPGKLYDE